ncbi:TetR family transcriptional regulator [Micrococcus lylae]|uniref:TetR family transcriptional regulator n=1 Tax=Micrococcus lylae TaxID=1273 RepID=UPI00215599D4|nr:TetR family transcriptional regulator [Micrococcus lylae]WIK81419.1 TetR family transcriptional regulator [Micrococcus lylae]
MTSAPDAPRPRGRLTVDEVVDAAVTILQDFGMGDLSMRRVAGVLGVQASALYWHVPNKQTLLARVADRIVADVERTVRAHRLEDLEELTSAAEAVLLRHRDGADVVLSSLALGLGGSALHRMFVETAPDPGSGERALAGMLGAAALRQQREQAAALGVELGPDCQAHARRGRSDQAERAAPG